MKNISSEKSGYFGFRQGIVKFSFYKRVFIIVYTDLFVGGKSVKRVLVCKSKFKSSELNSQLPYLFGYKTGVSPL